MPPTAEEAPSPVFEIDQPAEFAQFMLGSRREIVFYLNQLARRHSVLTAYLDAGGQFFPSSVIAVDETENLIFIDLPPAEEQRAYPQSAGRITLVVNLDRVKMQIRLPSLTVRAYQGHDALCAPIPEAILRLQRREFFRLEPPLATPIHCKLAAPGTDGTLRTFELTLSDISGSGVSLAAPPELGEYFPRDALFQHCRLDIPGEGVIQVNLRVHKSIEMSTRNGQRQLRIGCEFVNLPGTRLAFIEHYITRIERERQAKGSGLAD